MADTYTVIILLAFLIIAQIRMLVSKEVFIYTIYAYFLFCKQLLHRTSGFFFFKKQNVYQILKGEYLSV